MKKIIQGFRYDTEKAELVGEASASCPTSDFSYWEAGLYRTPRKKQFFLAGHGGPMTRFSKKIDQSTWSGGEGIFPLTKEEAYEWAEQNLEPEILERYFPDMIQDA